MEKTLLRYNKNYHTTKKLIMKTLKFKTNIKCGGCIAAVTPFLTKVQGIESWEVDTVNPDKILTVHTDNLDPEDVLTAIKAAGYNAESIPA